MRTHHNTPRPVSHKMHISPHASYNSLHLHVHTSWNPPVSDKPSTTTDYCFILKPVHNRTSTHKRQVVDPQCNLSIWNCYPKRYSASTSWLAALNLLIHYRLAHTSCQISRYSSRTKMIFRHYNSQLLRLFYIHESYRAPWWSFKFSEFCHHSSSVQVQDASTSDKFCNPPPPWERHSSSSLFILFSRRPFPSDFFSTHLFTHWSHPSISDHLPVARTETLRILIVPR